MEEHVEENLNIIQDLHSLINPHIPCDQSRILAVKYSRLKHADQYGSTLLKLTIELVNITTGEDWTLSAVAKTLPKYSIVHDISDIRALFKNEVGLYTTARCAIESFLKEKGMGNSADFFMPILGGRLNLNSTSEVDHNAVLIIRDLKVLGFRTVHRRTGFDLDSTKAILATFAKFHGTTLGLKIKKPKEFKDKVRPYLGKFYTTASFTSIARDHMIGVLDNEGFSQRTIERAVATFDRQFSREVREPWATFIHSNAWVKNIVIKCDKNKHPQDVKLRGLQESEYNSPLRDLLFFLFSSVQLVVLRQHLDELVDYYYFNFVNVLRNFDVDTKVFARPLFNQELAATASKGEFYKTVCMLYPILGTNLEIQNIGDDGYVPGLKDPLHINRLCYIVREFDKRDWLCL